MIELFIIAFVGGILTILAPCILPLLPAIIGGSSFHSDKKTLSLKHPLVIILSLAISIVIFTLLLKSTTALLGVPTQVWSIIAGIIILLLGINILFPTVWERVVLKTNFNASSNRLMARSQSQTGIKKDVLLGFALGPVFNSCSPTYALIVAVILPASFLQGFGYLLSYTAGLVIILLLITIFGRALIIKLRWLSNPHGIFKKMIGLIFIVFGIIIIFGLDKTFQSTILESGLYDPIQSIEEKFLYK